MKVLLDIPQKVLNDPHNYCCYVLADHIKGQPKITLNAVLDQIRVNIQAREMVEDTIEHQFYNMALNDVLQIIDKYKAESE